MKLNIGKDLYLKGRIGWRGLSKEEYLPFSKYKIINATSLADGLINWNNCGYISKERYDESPEIMLKENDILISKDGTIGKIGYVKKITTPCTVASGIFVLRNTKPDKINFDYLYHILKSYVFKGFIHRNKAQGSTISHLYQRDLENFEIEIPDISIQNQIAEVLNSLENKININYEIIRKLELHAKTLYDYWFLQFDFPNEKGKPYKASGGKMIKDKETQDEIPDGWKHLTLKEVVSQEKYAIVDGPFGTQMKVEDYVPVGIPVYEMDQLNGKFVIENPKHFISNNKYEQVKRSTARNGDIIISKTGTLGLLGVVKSDNFDKGVLVSRLAKITPDSKKIGTYTLLIMLQHLSDSGYWMKKSGGSTMPILNNQLLENVPVIFSESGIFEKFEKIITPYYETIYVLQQENKKLEELKNFLLPLLMNGQVTIK